MRKFTLRFDPEDGVLNLVELVSEGHTVAVGEISLFQSKDLLTESPLKLWSGWMYDSTDQFGNYATLDEIIDQMVESRIRDTAASSTNIVYIKQEVLNAYLKGKE